MASQKQLRRSSIVYHSNTPTDITFQLDNFSEHNRVIDSKHIFLVDRVKFRSILPIDRHCNHYEFDNLVKNNNVNLSPSSKHEHNAGPNCKPQHRKYSQAQRDERRFGLVVGSCSWNRDLRRAFVLMLPASSWAKARCPQTENTAL